MMVSTGSSIYMYGPVIVKPEERKEEGGAGGREG